MHKSFIPERKKPEPLRELTGTKAETRAWELMHEGYSPSQIDRKENLEEGTTHDLMVCAWKRDTEELQRERKRIKRAKERAK